MTGTLDGFLAADGVTASYSRVAGETVLGGPYAITSTLNPAAVLSNYTITNTPGVFNISERAITITADGKNKTYGDADPALTYQVTAGSLAFNDLFTGELTRDVGEAVGTYQIQQGTVALNNNYSLTYVPADLTIGLRSVEITADAKSKTYGDADPARTYQITAGSLAFSDAFTGELTRISGEAVDTYQIQQGTVALNDNYSLTYLPADLAIGPRSVEITANAKNKFCGQIDPVLTFQITAGSLAFSDSFTGALTRMAGEAVGIYQILQGSVALNSNYSLSYNSKMLEIKGVSLDVTDAQSPRSIHEDVILSIQVLDGVTLLSGVTVNITVGTTTIEATSVNGIATFNFSKLPSNLYPVTAQAGGCSVTEPVFLPIYDPNGGFVTGGGWIDSPANAMASGVVGRANFGFNAKYKSGKNNTNEVDGNTNFQFKAGDLHFSSSAHDNMSLVISGAKATYTGTGTINGMGVHKFRLIAVDGDISGGGEIDKFRIMIWENASSSDLVYDNKRGTSESSDDATAISGGSIVIHKPKGNVKSSETTEKLIVETNSALVETLTSLEIAPNPMIYSSEIRFSLLKDSRAEMKIFDMNGRLVKTLYSGNVKASEVIRLNFERDNLMSGIYICKLFTGDGKSYEKQIVIK